MGFVIRILAQRGLARAGFRDSHMGFALPSEQGGVHACIFYPVVEEWAQGGVTREQILGHALAHEIGHLLLSSNLHFPAGLMQAKWGPGELHRVSRGDLLFTREQVQTMRHELDRRVLRHHERTIPQFVLRTLRRFKALQSKSSFAFLAPRRNPNRL